MSLMVCWCWFVIAAAAAADVACLVAVWAQKGFQYAVAGLRGSHERRNGSLRSRGSRSASCRSRGFAQGGQPERRVPPSCRNLGTRCRDCKPWLPEPRCRPQWRKSAHFILRRCRGEASDASAAPARTRAASPRSRGASAYDACCAASDETSSANEGAFAANAESAACSSSCTQAASAYDAAAAREVGSAAKEGSAASAQRVHRADSAKDESAGYAGSESGELRKLGSASAVAVDAPRQASPT